MKNENQEIIGQRKNVLTLQKNVKQEQSSVEIQRVHMMLHVGMAGLMRYIQ